MKNIGATMKRKSGVVDPDEFSSLLVSNNSLVSDSAESTKSLSIAVDAVAASARESIALAKNSIPDTSLNKRAIDSLGAVAATEAISAIENRKGSDSKKRSRGTQPTNVHVPQLDSVSVKFNGAKGVGDGFVAKIVFSLPTASIKELRMVRIFRSVLERAQLIRPVSMISLSGMEKITSAPPRTSLKSVDQMSSRAITFEKNGIRNFISDVLPLDAITGLRAPRSSDEVNLDVSTDKSVRDDLQTVARFQRLENTTISRDPMEIVVGKNVIQKDSAARIGPAAVGELINKSRISSNVVVEKKNFDEFIQLSSISLDTLKGRSVGAETEFFFEDTGVQFGKSYRYFITSIDSSLRDSARSKIVQANIEHVVPVTAEFSVTGRSDGGRIVLNISCSDRIIEKFEVYKKSFEEKSRDIPTISGLDGHLLSSDSREPIGNNTTQIGESVCDPGAGSVFFDADVIPGRKYTYFVHAVDIFGNKTSDGKSIDVFFADRARGKNDLVSPTINAEQDSLTGFVKLTISSNDPRISTVRLKRRDMSSKDHAFVVPTQPSRIILGKFDLKSHASSAGVLFPSETSAWNGHIFLGNSGSITFVDRLVTIDRLYQYSLDGVDRYGNMSPSSISRPVFISRRPMIDHPVNVTAKFSSDENSPFVHITWEDSNIDIDAEEKIGNRETLANTSVRSLYQLERKEVGSDLWKGFPLTDEKSFVDRVLSSSHPTFRPEYIKVNREYQYRVAAIQTGSYFSNFTDPVSVLTSLPIAAPASFRIMTSAPEQRPFLVALNWNTTPGSGDVDFWEIDRAGVNVFAAERIDLRDPAQAAKLDFRPLCIVRRESSRFSSRSSDNDERISAADRVMMLSGQHHYIDADTKMGNSYFYRIRAVGIGGGKSDWVFRGVVVTSPSFSRKLGMIISQDERNDLSVSIMPMTISNRFLT